MSKQRDLILSIIQSSPEHLTADQVYQLAKQSLPNIAMATIYNNLKSLSQRGDIKRINLNDGADHYDKNTAPHEHILCPYCGKINDIHLDNFYQRIENELGQHIEGYSLTVLSVCADCADICH